MANLYGYDVMYTVFQIVKNNQEADSEKMFTLLFVKSFYDEGEATEWIIQHGDRQVDYTVLSVYRNK